MQEADMTADFWMGALQALLLAASVAGFAALHASGRRGRIGVGYSLLNIADRIAGRRTPVAAALLVSAALVAGGLLLGTLGG